MLDVVGRTDLRIVPGPVTSGSPSRRCPNTSAIRALTGHEPQVGLREGIAATYAWYRERVFEGGGPSAT